MSGALQHTIKAPQEPACCHSSRSDHTQPWLLKGAIVSHSRALWGQLSLCEVSICSLRSDGQHWHVVVMGLPGH